VLGCFQFYIVLLHTKFLEQLRDSGGIAIRIAHNLLIWITTILAKVAKRKYIYFLSLLLTCSSVPGASALDLSNADSKL
jgi:hypothetical protein